MDKYTYTKIKYSFSLCRKFKSSNPSARVIASKFITSMEVKMNGIHKR